MELTEQATPMYGKLVRENPKTLCICRLEVRLSEEDMITGLMENIMNYFNERK